MGTTLPSLITVPSDSKDNSEDPEDILSAGLSFLYPNATQNQHGEPGTTVFYKSPPNEAVRLHLSDPRGEEDRRLFAHYVWNASVFIAEALSNGKWFRGLEQYSRCKSHDWDVSGKKVLELGAGTGLSSLIAACVSAGQVYITDYPAAPILSSLATSVQQNLHSNLQSIVTVQSHCWGSLDDEFATIHSSSFTRILAADTLWMPSQHLPLAQSMVHFLSKDPGSEIWVVAGFHTGRAKVVGFFEHVANVGLAVKKRWEVDVDGNERDWADAREGEGTGDAARWTLVAILGWV